MFVSGWKIAGSELKWDYCKAFKKKCGISNALDGSEDDILYEESEASSENNHESILVAVTTIFWISMMNKLYYGC